jgi:lactam utilization protein B
MANIELKFLDDSTSGEFIQVYEYEGIISITGEFEEEGFCIHLDKSTAIKFAKTLRTEINKIQE